MGNGQSHCEEKEHRIQNFEERDRNNILLASAAASGNIEDVLLYMARGADINYRGRTGLTPLMLASISGHMDVCNLLIEFGCDVETRTVKTKETALTLAYKSGKKEVSFSMKIFCIKKV